jgi:hypothetical protein
MINVGTLISASIRPNDSLDPIASAWAKEVKGGLHTTTDSSDRNSIIFQRREWGMMCYVTNENKTYQLTYNYSNTDIMNNSNWKEFNNSISNGGEWIDSVFSIRNDEPISPTNGDRYIIGSLPTGLIWSSKSPGLVVQWNSGLSQWDETEPTNGTSVRVDDVDNSIWKYLGTFSVGSWNQEKSNLVRSLVLTSVDSVNYTGASNPTFSQYSKDIVLLTSFSSTNIGMTVSININGLGQKYVKKVSKDGLTQFNPSDIKIDTIYNLFYDGTYFQLTLGQNESLFNVKYYIEPGDYIVIPQYYQYWVYGDLTIAGTLVNYGHLITANGQMIISGSGSYGGMSGSQYIMAPLSLGLTTSYNDSSTIQFTQSNTILGLSVSAYVKDSSLTASKLDTGSNGGATAGYLLSVDNVGDFMWVNPTVGGGGSYSYFSEFDKNISPQNTNGDNQLTGVTISNLPLGTVGVYVNGVEVELGSTSSSCYFSDDGGFTAKNLNNISSGDELYWNDSVSEYSLTTTDRVSLYYLKN